MRVCVVGAGVIGMATACRLVQDGHEVTVLERDAQPGGGASFANGAQLSYSYVAPLADAGVLGKLPGYLLDRDSPLRIRPRLDPGFWRWCMQFLARCNLRDARASTVALLRLGALSRARMLEWASLSDGSEFGYRNNGKLVIYRDRRLFAAACEQMYFQKEMGVQQRALSVQECVALEPALTSIAPRLIGGIYTPGEDVADSYRFCGALAHWVQASGRARVLVGARVERFIRRGRHVVAVRSSRGEVETDAVVVAAGMDSRALLRSVGVSVPLLGLKGYSITVNNVRPERAPRVSITDSHHRIVFASFSDRMRVAGMIELGARDIRIDPARIAALARQAQENFPDAGDYSDLNPWAGFRPATPSGRPIIDRLGFENLFVNIGHGPLGLTLAMGSAELAADLIAGRRSCIDAALFRLANA